MSTGTPESLFFYLAILGISIFTCAVLLRLFKVKSLALAFMLGYLGVVVFAVLKGWRPLDPGGFDKTASEAVALSWPASYLSHYFTHKFHLIVIALACLQYCIAGWIVEMMAGSVLGDK
jgi:hypothetical protein